MNILFVNSINMFGGGEIWMLRTLASLKTRGHRVGLACRRETELFRRAGELAIPVYPLPIRGDLWPPSIFSAWKIIRKGRYNIILTNMDKELRFCGLASRLAGNSLVVSRRGIDYPLKNKIHYRLSYNWLADSVLANSQATKKALLKNAPWLDASRVTVIYNGIDPKPYLSPFKEDWKDRLSIPKIATLFGFVGQLDERKGIHALLEAFSLLRKSLNGDVNLLFVGRGPLDDFIRDWRAEHQENGRIHLAGFQTDISDIMKSIDALVLPSLWEGFGLVLIEAMAAGKPCVTTDVSSMPEIVLNGVTGRIVPVNNPEKLADALREIYENPLLSRRWGQSGRERVLKHFTMDKMIEQLERFFKDRWNRYVGKTEQPF
jgi:glycosyltransferase involved in cell wall biosynthesis